MTDRLGYAIDEGIEKGLVEALKAKKIPVGSFRDHVVQLLNRLGIDASPRLYLSESVIPNALVTGTKSPMVVVTQGAFNALGGSHLSRMTPEMEATIAHELGHFTRGGLTSMLAWRYLPMTLMPLAFIAAERHFHHKKQGEVEIPFADDPMVKPHESRLKRVATDLVAGAAGFFTGAEITRTNSIHEEFSCDKFAAEATSPEAMIKALQKLEKGMLKLIGKPLNPNDPILKISTNGGKSTWLGRYMHDCMMAHPATADRIDRLAKMGGKAAQKVADDFSHEPMPWISDIEWLGEALATTALKVR